MHHCCTVHIVLLSIHTLHPRFWNICSVSTPEFQRSSISSRNIMGVPYNTAEHPVEISRDILPAVLWHSRRERKNGKSARTGWTGPGIPSRPSSRDIFVP